MNESLISAEANAELQDKIEEIRLSCENLRPNVPYHVDISGDLSKRQVLYLRGHSSGTFVPVRAADASVEFPQGDKPAVTELLKAFEATDKVPEYQSLLHSFKKPVVMVPAVNWPKANETKEIYATPLFSLEGNGNLHLSFLMVEDLSDDEIYYKLAARFMNIIPGQEEFFKENGVR